jgi:spore coat protein CotH
VNWDSYGCMPHNYYVYADPGSPTTAAPLGRFRWFPWDLNEAMLPGAQCDFSAANELIPDATVINSGWPLIRFLLDDAVYLETYRAALTSAISAGGAFEPTWVDAQILAYHELIAPYAVGPQAREAQPYTFLRNDSDFTGSAVGLQTHVQGRYDLARTVLGL